MQTQRGRRTHPDVCPLVQALSSPCSLPVPCKTKWQESGPTCTVVGPVLWNVLQMSSSCLTLLNDHPVLTICTLCPILQTGGHDLAEQMEVQLQNR